MPVNMYPCKYKVYLHWYLQLDTVILALNGLFRNMCVDGPIGSLGSTFLSCLLDCRLIEAKIAEKHFCTPSQLSGFMHTGVWIFSSNMLFYLTGLGRKYASNITYVCALLCICMHVYMCMAMSVNSFQFILVSGMQSHSYVCHLCS